MASSNEDLWRLFDQVGEMPYGGGQIAAVEQLIRRADASDDAHLAFAVRMLASNAYLYGGEPARSFVTFSWCLGEFDNNPQPYHQRYEHNLLWSFKSTVHALLRFPEVPLDRTMAVLDDMDRRYREGGHSPQAVYKVRYRVASHLGKDDEAEEWYRRWVTTARDDLSDCAGCDPSRQIRHLAATGRDEEAVAMAEPVLAGRLSCVEQPQDVLTSLLLPYLRTGRRDEARDAHRRAYRRYREGIANLGGIGDHLKFCALTGNEARGLELVERHLDWLDRPPTPGAAMTFAASAALVLRRLTEAGHGTLTVRRHVRADRPADEVTVGALAEEMATTATGLGARFDDRNGTDSQSRWVTRRMSLEPIGPYLPLSATARRRPAATAPAASLAGSGGGPGDEPAPARPAVPFEVPPDAGPGDLLELAEQAWRTERNDRLAEVLRVFDERFGERPSETSVAARRSEFRAVQRHLVDDRAGAMAAHRESMALHRQVPDPLREQIVAGRLGVLLVLGGEAAEGMALLETSTAYLAEHGDAAQRAVGYDRLTLALAEQGRASEALDAADRAATEAAGTDDAFLVARVALHRIPILEMLERRAEAGVTALRARDLYRELDLPDHLAAACLAYANSFDDPGAALPAYDEAVRLATERSVLPARTRRARALVAADRPGEAIDDFVEAVALCAERGITEGAAFLRWELAEAYQRAGRALDAAEVAEEAVPELDRLGHQASADRCRRLLADAYAALGEHESALRLLDQLADNLDGPDNLPARAEVLEEAGGLLYRQDRDQLAAERFASSAAAYRLAGLPLNELRARRQEVAALHWADEATAALDALARADEVVARLRDEPAAPDRPERDPAVVWERAMLAEAGARVMLTADRPETALERLRGVPDALRSIQAFSEALQIEMLAGEALLRLDRAADAEAVLRAALAGAPDHSDLQRRAAWLLCHALTILDRTAEVDAVRAEYGLDNDE